MDNKTKHYTEAFAKQMLSDIQNGVVNEKEAVTLRRQLIEEIEASYNNFRMRLGGGIIQPEERFINHTVNAMKRLKLEYTGYNVFVAACAMSSVMLRLYGPMGGFAGLPDLSTYNTGAGIADIMNKIVTFFG